MMLIMMMVLLVGGKSESDGREKKVREFIVRARNIIKSFLSGLMFLARTIMYVSRMLTHMEF